MWIDLSVGQEGQGRRDAVQHYEEGDLANQQGYGEDPEASEGGGLRGEGKTMTGHVVAGACRRGRCRLLHARRVFW